MLIHVKIGCGKKLFNKVHYCSGSITFFTGNTFSLFRQRLKFPVVCKLDCTGKIFESIATLIEAKM